MARTEVNKEYLKARFISGRRNSIEGSTEPQEPNDYYGMGLLQPVSTETSNLCLASPRPIIMEEGCFPTSLSQSGGKSRSPFALLRRVLISVMTLSYLIGILGVKGGHNRIGFQIVY